VAAVRRDLWLVRAIVCLVLFALVASVLSPQPVGWATFADIRYMSTAIPLAIFISARTVWLGFRLDRDRSTVRTAAAVAVSCALALTKVAPFGAHRLIGGPGPMAVRSTLLAWLGELVSPPPSAYAAASAWLNHNLPAGSNVFALPDFSLYPLMFHAPQHHYMWQFSPQQHSEYPMLQPFNFRYFGVPDAVVGFGSEVAPVQGLIQQLERLGVRYEAVNLGVAGPDATRPELFWHRFHAPPPDPRESTWIFKRVQK